MKRSLMQVYVSGSKDALDLYQRAFDVVAGEVIENSDGSLLHAELDIGQQILALSEVEDSESGVTGNTMQFCLHYGEENEDAFATAYEMLKEKAHVLIPLGPCDFSPQFVDLIDRFGVRWCLFI